jgi:hypothetical protein
MCSTANQASCTCGRATSISVAPSARWFVALAGIPAAVFLPPPIFASMTAADRSMFVGLTAVFALTALAASRNRLTVHGVELGQRVVLRSRYFRLDRLAGVRVFRAAGRYNHPWQMTLTDSAGVQMHLRLNGYPVEDRKQLMAALAPFVRRPGVQLEGRVDEALAGGLWFPHLRRVPAEDS